MNLLNYEQKLQKYQSIFVTIPKFNYLLQQMQQVIIAYRQQLLPNFVLSKLEVTAGDFADLMTNSNFLPMMTLPAKSQFLQNFAKFLDNFRDFIQKDLGIWTLLNAPMMQRWTALFPHLKYLELMAGNGILAHSLQQRGQRVRATDNLSWATTSATGNKPWTTIEKSDALSALLAYYRYVDVVLLSWSPDRDPIDYQILTTIRQLTPRPQFWIIGEYQGATNSLEFWQEARLIYDSRLAQINRLFPSFDLIKDHLFKIG